MSTETSGAEDRAIINNSELANRLFDHLHNTLNFHSPGYIKGVPGTVVGVCKIRSRLFEAYVRNLAYELFRAIPSRQVVRTVIDQLEASLLIQSSQQNVGGQ